MFLVPKLDAVSVWGLMSAEISWLFLLLQPSMLLVFAAVSFLRSSWPVVPTTVPALEEWQSCWDFGLCLHGCLDRTPVLCLESLSSFSAARREEEYRGALGWQRLLPADGVGSHRERDRAQTDDLRSAETSKEE